MATQSPHDTKAQSQPAVRDEAKAAAAAEEKKVAAIVEADDDKSLDRALLATLPEDVRGQEGASLLAEACFLYGVNPDPNVTPQELLNWKFYKGDSRDPQNREDRVVIVTAGGTKLSHPMNDATEEVLRDIHRAYYIDKRTNERFVRPLPEDVTLPRARVTGIPERVDQAGSVLHSSKSDAQKAADATRAAIRSKSAPRT